MEVVCLGVRMRIVVFQPGTVVKKLFGKLFQGLERDDVLSEDDDSVFESDDSNEGNGCGSGLKDYSE